MRTRMSTRVNVSLAVALLAAIAMVPGSPAVAASNVHAMKVFVGYADGLPHRLSNKGRIIADGKAAAILGTVSMDLTTLDLSHTQALKAGDEVTILGQEGEAKLDAQQIARLAGTISYNILCGISARVKRLYVE